MEITAEFSSSAGRPPESLRQRFLGFWIDGNTIQLCDVSREPGGKDYQVEGLAGHEDKELLEVVERFRHPIFMDVHCVQYPHKKRIGDVVKRLLDRMQPETVRTVGCMAGESVQILQKRCGDTDGECRAALRSLLEGFQNSSPFHFPIFFTIRHESVPGEDGVHQVVLSLTHFREIEAFLELMDAVPLKLAALSNSLQAITRAASQLGKGFENGDILITDVGRLRTHYVCTRGDSLVLSQSIPIGIARNDHHFLKALPLRMKDVAQLVHEQGALLLPPDVTPPPLADPSQSTPQLDCTHIASQVAQYLKRAVERTQTNGSNGQVPIQILTGLPSRVPGFRKYLESRTGYSLRRPENLDVDGVQFRDERNARRFADFLVPIGGTLRAMGSQATGITATPFGTAPFNLGGAIPVEDLEPGVVYEVDRPFKIR